MLLHTTWKNIFRLLCNPFTRFTISILLHDYIFCKFFSFGSGYFSIKGILQLEANMPGVIRNWSILMTYSACDFWSFLIDQFQKSFKKICTPNVHSTTLYTTPYIHILGFLLQCTLPHAFTNQASVSSVHYLL